ncbi:hypothetical protein ARSQ2_01687 [Arsenophonus endosymbiont of Bemisia tabaci Q2]|nr:hypothetical protein ARSQ2_01687 [Arsenophonus endosymbiont of Bemisia tabaci Q2]
MRHRYFVRAQYSVIKIKSFIYMMMFGDSVFGGEMFSNQVHSTCLRLGMV